MNSLIREKVVVQLYYPHLINGKIINDRYSSEWNIYATQASDGDVWDNSDAIGCAEILRDKLLSKIQYMIYIVSS